MEIPLETPQFAVVILDQEIKKPLDYSIPSKFLESAQEGARVLVPLRGKPTRGTIISLKKTTTVPTKPILEVLSDKNTLLPQDLLTLSAWMSSYYFASEHQVFRTILPPSVRNTVQPKKRIYILRNKTREEIASYAALMRNEEADACHVLDILLQNSEGLLLSDLEEMNISKKTINHLIKKKLLKSELITPFSPLECDFFPSFAKKLSQEQAESLDKIKKTLKAGEFQTHLLFGVTGSGKTEVYLQAIEEALRLDKSSILLVPEIALTTQTVERLKSRFQRKIAILHHRLAAGERWDLWHQIRKKEIMIVVGARGAVFSPMSDLGLLIVDEEHESSYKQSEEPPCYHARDIAVMRGKLTQSTVILGSATPSLESFHNAEKGKYLLSTLKERPKATLPKIHIVDMQPEWAKGYTLFSDVLLQKIKERFDVGEQSILFLNRRGFHTVQLCKTCGASTSCPHCDVSLTHHMKENSLMCHLCDYTLSPPPKKCPSCGSIDTLKFKGSGTEQVEKALKDLFPQIRTLRMDADTTKKRGSHDTFFKQFRSGKADVLIGTQMIAKGLHFPAVTLVGVLNTDAALHFPDFRAAEHLFQLATQVSGRAGRGALPGEVYIQTLMPHHPLFSNIISQDYSTFYASEMKTRELFRFPPYIHLVRLIFSGPSEEKTLALALEAHALLVSLLPPHFELHPPIPCGHKKINQVFRVHFIVKTLTLKELAPAIQRLRSSLSKEKDMRCLIDVDPLSTFS